MASGTDEKAMYACMAMSTWAGSILHAATPEKIESCTDGSIGFMPVFDDVEKLKEAYPDAEIMQITRMRD